jgi:hypothetical protein
MKTDVKYVLRPHMTFTGTEIKIREPQRQSSMQERIIATIRPKSHFDFSKKQIN